MGIFQELWQLHIAPSHLSHAAIDTAIENPVVECPRIAPIAYPGQFESKERASHYKKKQWLTLSYHKYHSQ